MIRSDNPFNQILAASFGVYRFRLPARTVLEPAALRSLAGLGATIEKLDETTDSTYWSVEVPHGNSDAFGALLLLGRLTSGATLLPLSEADQSGTWRDLRFHHFFETRPPAGKQASTFTQSFWRALIAGLPNLAQENLAMAVSLDDLEKLTPETSRGNSLSIVTLEGTRWAEWSGLPKPEWSANLATRARRTVDWARRKPQSARELGPLLISSLGRLNRFSWLASPFDPARFLMFPTPTSTHSANVILWSFGDRQALSVTASPEHWVHRQLDALKSAWRGAR